MHNPYEAPHSKSSGNSNSSRIRRLVGPPATALMVVAGIAVVVGMLSLVVDVLLIASGAVQKMEAMNRGPISKQTTVLIRTAWGVILVIASCYVFYGALKMKSMTDYGKAKGAAIVAMIPLLGPCCILGIPFGIWAFTTPNKPEVQHAFKSKY